jgi:hypothetical protein
MKLLKKLASAAALTMAFAASASAANVINNWTFNPQGTGFAGGTVVNESLDVNGNAFINLTATGANTFSFTESAAFSIGGKDGGLSLGNYANNITATFQATGTGTFNGAFTFTGGTINIYSSPTNVYGSTTGIYGANNGELIASFTVLAGGGGLVDGTGNPTGNGQVSVFAQALTPGGLDAGYFFNSAGVDLSTQDILSFAFTNANGTGTPSATAVSEIACEFAGYTGAGCNGTAYSNIPGQAIFVGNNGQFKLAEVPEPGSLALFGIAMLGAGVVSRKRAASKAA